MGRFFIADGAIFLLPMGRFFPENVWSHCRRLSAALVPLDGLLYDIDFRVDAVTDKQEPGVNVMDIKKQFCQKLGDSDSN
jgi:hypothetical protein